MKLINYAYSIVLLTSGVIATPRGRPAKHDRIPPVEMPSRSIALCPSDQWRPLSPYKSTAFPNPWWFLPDADEANKAHYEVTHTSLPPEYLFPNPLLPTDNATIEKYYTTALRTYEADVRMQKRPDRDCEIWLKAINKFHIMCRCVHMWWWQCTEIQGERHERVFDKPLYEARYNKLKAQLDNQMRYEGVVGLGRRIKEIMQRDNATGTATAL